MFDTVAGMMEWFRHRRVVRFWGPVFLWMVVISFFSSRSVLPRPFSSPKHGRVSRGVAHFGEFAILSVLLYRALASGYQSQESKGNSEEDDPPWSRARSTSKGRPFALSFVIGLLFAVLDESHQSFVPGRHFGLADLVLDVAGMGTALLVIGGWLGLRRQRRG